MQSRAAAPFPDPWEERDKKPGRRQRNALSTPIRLRYTGDYQQINEQACFLFTSHKLIIRSLIEAFAIYSEARAVESSRLNQVAIVTYSTLTGDMAMLNKN